MKKPERFIIVDDDSTSNLICEFTIRRFYAEAEIQIFNKPEEALSEIKNEASGKKNIPTIVFLDLNMPTMSGLEFLNCFKEFHDSVKEQFIIYVLTSSIQDFSEEAELYPMVSGFISKPLNKDALKKIQEKHF